MRQALRLAALTASLFVAFVVAALPGTTNASSTPARLVAEQPAAGPPPADEVEPLLVPVTLADLMQPIEEPPPPAPTPVHASIFEGAQVVSVYGHPGVCVMGELGCHPDPADAVQAARDLAAEYDALNGDRQTLAALHLIVDVAQATPGADGRYLEQMPLETVRAWVDLAREHQMLLFLDIQIGWSDLMSDVRRLGTFLAEPHVHLAIDPEFATKSEGLAPGLAIGELLAADVNAVQAYLAQVVAENGIPPKALVLHQFRQDMLPDAHDYDDVDQVEVVLDMDGWGPPWPKSENYRAYALADYAERPAIKLFFHWDEPLMTPADVMALPIPPDYVIYQ
ncbi:MAG: hypothetical protein M0R73_10790 [Dehalococcoidia bacterium]|nr:hypothetical protein [Dehalococcoidia bacterium]